MRWQFWAIAAVAITMMQLTGLPTVLSQTPGVRYDPGTAETIPVVTVTQQALLHTVQLSATTIPQSPPQPPARTEVQRQTQDILQQLEGLLAESGSDVNKLLKLHLVATTQEAMDAAVATIESRYPIERRPVLSRVISRLPRAGSAVAIDAVAAVAKSDSQVQPILNREKKLLGAILPYGPHAYISGQAEPGKTPEEAAANTIASLKRTLDFLGARPSDVVQAKCFLTPMSAAVTVSREFDKAFGPSRVPLVFVEWKSSLPIEIEMITACPPGKTMVPALEFLTPPGMTTPTIYCRVARIQTPTLLYLPGLVSRQPGNGEEQVRDIFAQLRTALSSHRSDFRHLVKATYYVSAEDSSQKLNELRPLYYDPKRPPAASKAQVSGIGWPNRSITMDLIAVPK
jgi:enamine deaminase RidA (YjgF/YER057c/UK114 family)